MNDDAADTSATGDRVHGPENDTRTDTGSGQGTRTSTSTETGTEIGTGIGAETGAGTGAGTSAGTGAGIGSASGAAFGSCSAAGGEYGPAADRRVFGDWPADALGAVERAFAWLCTRPHPVTVDGRAVAGLPAAPVPLDELRARLLDPRTPAAVGDRVWAHLIRRARIDGPSWTTACAGMAAPMLAGLVRSLTARIDGDPGEVRAEITSETLTGFLAALHAVDPDRAPLVSLRWAAYRAGHAAAVEAFNAPRPIPPRTGGDGPGYDGADGGDGGGAGVAGRVGHPRRGESGPPTAPGHPDLVLARAVADGALTVAEAALIGVTRLEPVTVAQAAAALGAPPATVWSRRHRGEAHLIAYLTDDQPTRKQATRNQATRNQADPGNASRSGGAGPGVRRAYTDDAARSSDRDRVRARTASDSSRRRRRTRRLASTTTPATATGTVGTTEAPTRVPAGRTDAGSATASPPPSGPASHCPAAGPGPGSLSGGRPGSGTRVGGHAERGPEVGA